MSNRDLFLVTRPLVKTFWRPVTENHIRTNVSKAVLRRYSVSHEYSIPSSSPQNHTTNFIGEILYPKNSTKNNLGIGHLEERTRLSPESESFGEKTAMPKSTQSISSILSVALQNSESSNVVGSRGLLTSSNLRSKKSNDWDTVLSGVFETSDVGQENNHPATPVKYSTRDRVDNDGSRVYGQDTDIEALFETPIAFSTTVTEPLKSSQGSSSLLSSSSSPISPSISESQQPSHDIDAILREARNSKIAYDQSKFRQQNAYEWSKNLAGRSPRTFELQNFFTPFHNENGHHKIPSMEYAIVTPSAKVIFRNGLILGNINRKNIQTVITDLLRPELYQDKIIELQNNGWIFIGTSNGQGSPEANLLFERMNPPPGSSSDKGHLKKVFTATLASLVGGIYYYYTVSDSEKTVMGPAI
ncbi:hypothetical protein NADFUDRAFT_53581 [Nadsonia fulvescens var. elongata DSM 6958]|uniref:Uncharacterized protein n=1 Tax=Nadsonia fulvescens var. elongata DSM 6958 TaxID=857566 RepID=A0A1E3PD65_9ASCO|nr:hypothetical protein NADFUDRAFT_53581 [Nadsonia fulvescens var. elongata DSM 6958]